MAIRLVTLRCPAQHWIAGTAYAWPDMAPAEAEARVLAWLIACDCNPWCGICGSRDLSWHHERTGWRTLAAGRAAVAELEQAQAALRARLGNRY